MEEKYIEVHSYWKVTIKNEYITQNSDTLVVLLPGKKYTNLAPIFYYSFNLALQFGYDVLALNYGFQLSNNELEYEERGYVISECKEAIEKALNYSKYKKIIFIGKSMGTAIQNQLIKDFKLHEQIHIFITPIPECIEGIEKSKSMVIVGETDPFFRAEHIDRIETFDNVELKILENVDHSLDTEDYRKSIDVLKVVLEEIYNYIVK